MPLNQHLILASYCHSRSGVQTFEPLKRLLGDCAEGADEEGTSHFCRRLLTLPGVRLPKDALLRYDERILEYAGRLRHFLEEPDWACARLAELLDGRSGFRFQDTEQDLFGKHLDPLRQEFAPAAARDLYDHVRRDVFHGTGGLEVWEIKQAEGEFGLRVSGLADSALPYFGVINIGDTLSFRKHIEETLRLTVHPDSQRPSLFASVEDPRSRLNLLIGARKFIEGWSSWRVSTMALLNLGRGEGSQIMQLFGRGVRLKGKDLSLKRSEHLPPPAGGHPPSIRKLETLYILGWNADYMAPVEMKVGEADYQYRVQVRVPAGNDLLTQIEGMIREPLAKMDAEEPVPRLYVDWHLYNPLFREFRDHGDVATVFLPGLKPSEEKFLKDVRDFWRANHGKARYATWELYLLRNPAMSGVFLAGPMGRFFPDFILWFKHAGSGRTIVRFLEPHGFHDETEAQVRSKAQCLAHLAVLSAQANFREQKVQADGWLLSATTALSGIPWAGDRDWATMEREFRILPMADGYMSKAMAIPGR
jgi:hypothetical protein